jgi:hypothetical protein
VTGSPLDPGRFEDQLTAMLKDAVAGVTAPPGLSSTVQLGIVAPTVAGLFGGIDSIAAPAGLRARVAAGVIAAGATAAPVPGTVAAAASAGPVMGLGARLIQKLKAPAGIAVTTATAATAVAALTFFVVSGDSPSSTSRPSTSIAAPIVAPATDSEATRPTESSAVPTSETSSTSSSSTSSSSTTTDPPTTVPSSFGDGSKQLNGPPPVHRPPTTTTTTTSSTSTSTSSTATVPVTTPPPPTGPPPTPPPTSATNDVAAGHGATRDDRTADDAPHDHHRAPDVDHDQRHHEHADVHDRPPARGARDPVDRGVRTAARRMRRGRAPHHRGRGRRLRRVGLGHVAEFVRHRARRQSVHDLVRADSGRADLRLHDPGNPRRTARSAEPDVLRTRHRRRLTRGRGRRQRRGTIDDARRSRPRGIIDEAVVSALYITPGTLTALPLATSDSPVAATCSADVHMNPGIAD